jgi:DNA-binding response OmpR family regulator
MHHDGWMRVLVVEDDARFAAALCSGLRRGGYQVDLVATAADVPAAPQCDLVLLDLGLPDGDGIEVCRKLRQETAVGIIMLTARGQEVDRVAGLRCGADDYVVKPFGFAELYARMEAVLRRAHPRPAGVRIVGRLRVDLDRHSAHAGAEPIGLTRKEFQLLALLMAEPERVVRRERLFCDIWHTSWHGTSRTLDAHMTSLRSKIGKAARIETVRGVGYRILAGP